jgi:hypothetical protein
MLKNKIKILISLLLLSSCSTSKIIKISKLDEINNSFVIDMLEYCRNNVDNIYVNKWGKGYQYEYTQKRDIVLSKDDIFDIKFINKITKQPITDDAYDLNVEFTPSNWFDKISPANKENYYYNYIKNANIYNKVSVKELILACDHFFLKDRWSKIEEEQKKKKILEEQIARKEESKKQEEKDQKKYIEYVNDINNKIKKLGFVNGFFGYNEALENPLICYDYIQKEDKTVCLNQFNQKAIDEEYASLFHILEFASITRMNYALKEGQISLQDAKKSLIIQVNYDFIFNNFNKEYAFFTHYSNDSVIAIKKSKNHIYMQGSYLKSTYFRVVKLISVSNQIKNSGHQILLLEEVKFNKKQIDWLDSQINCQNGKETGDGIFTVPQPLS